MAHVCGDACTERVLDRSCDLPVCPISGRCFSRMVFPWEVCGSPSFHTLANITVRGSCLNQAPSLCLGLGSTLYHGSTISAESDPACTCVNFSGTLQKLHSNLSLPSNAL